MSLTKRTNLTLVDIYMQSGPLSPAELLTFLYCYMCKNLILYKYRRLINTEQIYIWLRQLKNHTIQLSRTYNKEIAR